MLPLHNFKQFIRTHRLFQAGQRVLLAVSGGRDSVLMVHLFKEAGFSFGIAHGNFNLRADESQRDESFVRMLAATLDVPFYVTQFPTKAYAEAQKISTQMAARTLRYQWFEEIRQQEGYDLIALAQHQDDAIETVLLNLTRGTGIAGLHGILPKRDRLIRPMLFMNRQEIDLVIEQEDISYVEDSSNMTDHYARNKIRHQVLPSLKAINPKLEQTFQQNIRRFAETEQVLQRVVSVFREDLFQMDGQQIIIPFEKLAALEPKQLLLFELLRPYGFSETVVSDLISSVSRPHSGTSFYSSSHVIVVDRQRLILQPLPEREAALNFLHPEDTACTCLDRKIGIYNYAFSCIEQGRDAASVDADKLIYPLIMRPWQEGDRFKPLGMKGYKKLSDFFIAQKVPLTWKAKIPILVNGNGEIIWVAGYRQDDRYKVTASTTRTVVFRLEA